jgi:Tol biopolymer transport system component
MHRPLSYWLAVFLVEAVCAAPTAAQSHRPGATETIAIRVHEGTYLALDLSPDGRHLAFDLLGQLWEIPSAGGVARALTDAVRDTAEDGDPSYSPGTDAIVFRGERHGRTGLWLLEPGGPPLQLTQLEDPDGYEGEAAWSPDGKGLAFARFLGPDSASPRPRTRLMWLELATRTVRELPIPQDAGPFLRDPSWAPDGKRLAFVSGPAGTQNGGRLWVAEVGGTAVTPLLPPTVRALAPVFSPDGRSLAYFAPDSAGRIQIWRTPADTAARAIRLTDHADVSPTRVRWTRDGTQLIYSADGRLWRVPAAGGAPSEIPFTVNLSITRERRTLPQSRYPDPGLAQPVRAFMGLAISPDARSVAMLALGKLWLMPVGGTPRSIADVPLSARQLAWAPDGATIAWAAGPSWGEDVYATDLASGSTRRVTALPGREQYPAYSPDGRHLLVSHQPNEDTTIVRVLDAGAVEVSDTAQGQAFIVANRATVQWTPGSDGLLAVTGGYGRGPTQGAILGTSGARRDITRMPDSPLFLQWRGNAIVYLRHARLWRASFDSSGMLASPEPLGSAPAMYFSVANDGTILYISEGGLRLRAPDGREQRLGWPLSYTPPVPPPVLIRNARIIDGTGAPATPRRDVLVKGGRISRITAPGRDRPGTARVLEADGGFLIPGLMDLHAHEYRPDLLPGFSYFGVTTIRDQGAPIGPLVGYADAIAAGKMDGPRVDYGGFQLYSDWAYDLEDGQGVEPEADPEHAARVVELARAFSSQHIKTRTFRRWDINARFIAEAHRRGMRVTGHCSHLLPLVAAGMDAKEHAGFCEPRSDGIIYDDLVQLYRAAGIGVVPTIIYSAFAVRLNRQPDMLGADSALAPFIPPRSDFNWMLELDSTRQKQFADFARYASLATARLARGGVTVGTGTDIWQIPIGVHLELEELVAAGLSPLEAIHAATGGAARILGAEQGLGTIAVGKAADLVLLDADPLADIRNTRRIRAVLQGGRVVDRASLVARLGREEGPRPSAAD